jgi:hypothetical protein
LIKGASPAVPPAFTVTIVLGGALQLKAAAAGDEDLVEVGEGEVVGEGDWPAQSTSSVKSRYIG